MKLIKQNDSAGGLIFKQNTNGKAMKQNYNFGKSFIVTVSTSIYFDIPVNIGINDSFTILLFAKKKANSSNNPQILRVNALTDTFFSFRASDLNNSIAVGAILSQNQKVLTGFSYQNGSVRYIDESGNILSFYSLMGEAATFLRVGLSGATVGKMVINNLIIYNRAVSDAEMIYLKNNNLGNDILNTFGMIRRYKMDKFEIFNNSYVGFRDYSQNSLHRPVIGLPVGTLQEQLDYANNNLIESW